MPIELWIGQQPIPGLALGRRAVVGNATTILDPRMPLTLDELSSMTVRLANPSQLLLGADADALMAGANLAMIGDELIQFGRAEMLEPGLYRLSRLLRGRRGTEWAGQTHRVGERFCIFNPVALAAIELPAGTNGAILRAVSHGIGDFAPLPEAQRLISGEAMRPPSVCHLRAWRLASDVHLSWVRRSQGGWSWIDGVGVPFDPYHERYEIRVTGPGGQMAVETDRPLAAFDLGSLPGQPGESVEFQVSMAGPKAMSRPRSISLIL